MVNKIGFFIVLLIFFGSLSAFAQTNRSESSSYSILETEEGTRFVQRIDWIPMDGIRNYEIIIERRFGNSSRYDEFLRETSEEPFLELSLPAGNYRFKVLGYNVLGRLGAESDYQPFEIFQAVQPRISEVTPASFFLDEESPRRIAMMGENFVLGSEIYLVPIQRHIVNNSSNQKGVLVPIDIIYSDIGDMVELVFNEQNLPADSFRIVVVNPGGLTTTYAPFDIKRTKKPTDINVSFGFAPLIPFLPFNPSEYHLSTVMESGFYPLGLAAKASLIPFKTQYGNFGAEISPFYNFLNSTKEDTSVLQGHVLGLALSVVYQKPFLEDTLFLNAWIGGGFASYLDLHFVSENTTLSAVFPEAQIGASVQYFVYQQLFLEFGLDFKFFFADEMFTVYINPILSAGWRF